MQVLRLSANESRVACMSGHNKGSQRVPRSGEVQEEKAERTTRRGRVASCSRVLISQHVRGQRSSDLAIAFTSANLTPSSPATW